MSILKIKLTRNLRRSILQGQPWIYKDSIQFPKAIEKAQICLLSDGKGEDLAWAFFDPHSPLSLRILSTDLKIKGPPSKTFFEKRFERAQSLRKFIDSEQTTAYRLFNGEGDNLPGLVCDVYGETAVVQFDGQGPIEFWDKELITQWLIEKKQCKRVIEKSRGKEVSSLVGSSSGDLIRKENRSQVKTESDSINEEDILIKENGITFKVNIKKGQKTGFFLDQRDNRNYIRQVSKACRVLNLFSYTGGFSVYAGLGGATMLASLDVSKGAIDLASENWALNGLASSSHQGLCVDVFEYLNGEKELWDHIIVDPPSMSHSESQKPLAIAKYTQLFAAAAKRVQGLGQLSLSSCSSHISFEDFFEIIREALSLARRKGQILRVSGQGADHPFPHACPEMRYLKFVHLALD